MTTVRQYLKGRIKKNELTRVLADNWLNDVDVKEFFRKFGKMTKDELVAFLKDDENRYEIAKFSYRYGGRDNIRARVWYGYDQTDQAY